MGKYHGKPTPQQDGTEGYLSLTISTINQSQKVETFRTIGYFVKENSTLTQYLGIPSGYKNGDPGLFMYFYFSEPGWKERLLNLHFNVYRSIKPKKVKEGDVKKSKVEELCMGEPHTFLSNTCHKNLKTTEFVNFFKKNSKYVTTSGHPLQGLYRGVQNTDSKPMYLQFKLKCVLNNYSGLYIEEEANAFGKLGNGPLLCREGDEWNLVGWYEKDSQNNRLIVHHLKAQEPFYIWKDLQSCPNANEHQGGSNQPGNTTDVSIQPGSLVDQPASDQGNNEPTQPGLSAQPSASTNNEPNSLESAVQLSTSSNSEPNRPEPAYPPSTSGTNEPNRPEPDVQPSTSGNNDPNQPEQYQANLNHQNRGLLAINGTIRVITAAGMESAWAAGSAFFLYHFGNNPTDVSQLVLGAIVPAALVVYLLVRAILPGSFKIVLEIQALDALQEIWKSYKNGDLENRLKDVIVTDELRSKAPDDAEDVDISITISEDDYRKTRDYLLEIALRNYIEVFYRLQHYC